MDPPLHHKNPHPLPSPSTERLLQWTHAETRELLAARYELDASFAESKRNKALWEAAAARLRQKGFLQNPEQCKSKWKNLVTRFKGSEAMEGLSDQFPFQDEMRSIFAERTERLLRFDRGKGPVVEADNEEEQQKSKKKRKKKVVATKEGEAEAALREFARRQMEMELSRIEAAEAREVERRSKEEEWRREMEALTEERAAAERRWMEREEERRAREEATDERRQAVIAAIASRLANRGDH